VREQAADKTEINVFLSVRIVNRDRSDGSSGIIQKIFAIVDRTTIKQLA
jgi:hypothetical protein